MCLQQSRPQRQSRMAVASVAACLLVGGLHSRPSAAAEPDSSNRPNVLFIAMDDLNDWVGCLGGHPQTITPNLDRLAASGLLFTNAHCPGAACNPSRTAIMTGRSPHRSGLYANGQKMREVLPDADLLPQYFRNHGYRASGSGKLLHYFIDARSWDEYFPAKETEDPFPRTLYPQERPVSLPRGGPWQYVETDWAALDATDEEYGGDWLVTKWVSEQLQQERAEPFFLACGIYRPHEPWFVPKKYFEPFPLADIQLPPGYKADDLDDLPPAGKKRGPNRYFPHIREQGQWKQGIQGYLASIHFADAMLGRVLQALDDGPHRDNTIVVLWSDHGWHLGEKQHWQKFTAWRAVTHVPLIVRVPRGTPGLSAGTTAGSVCTRPVNLLSLYPTLTALAGLPAKDDNDAPDLRPLLSDPQAAWNHVSLTHLGEPGSYGLSTEDWRYIHYANDDEELYHIADDPYEWTNLAGDPQHADQLTALRAAAPQKFAPLVKPRLESLPALTWQPADDTPVPASEPDGNTFDVAFVNKRSVPVELFWMDRQGLPKTYGLIPAGEIKRQRTRPGAVWLLATPEENTRLGHFVVGDRAARAEVPPLPARHKAVDPPQSRDLDTLDGNCGDINDAPERLRIKGWTVHLNRELRQTEPEKTSEMLDLLTVQLERVVRTIPPKALQSLRSVPLWINPSYDGVRPTAEYHPGAGWLRDNGRDPAMVKAVEITNVSNFAFEHRRMPYLLLHELAHAYHDQVLGFDQPAVVAAFEVARESGGYEQVQRFNGRTTVTDKAYALSNHKEYFAESTEAYFGKNDFYPFNRSELKTHDRQMHDLLQTLWGVQ